MAAIQWLRIVVGGDDLKMLVGHEKWETNILSTRFPFSVIKGGRRQGAGRRKKKSSYLFTSLYVFHVFEGWVVCERFYCWWPLFPLPFSGSWLVQQVLSCDRRVVKDSCLFVVLSSQLGFDWASLFEIKDIQVLTIPRLIWSKLPTYCINLLSFLKTAGCDLR